MNFNERCYALLKQIPKGRVTTYRLLAEALGTKAYRAVGRAMATNPNPIVVPCHRVIKSDGRIGNYTTDGVEDGSLKKQELLENEGIMIKDGRVQGMDSVIYDFNISSLPTNPNKLSCS